MEPNLGFERGAPGDGKAEAAGDAGDQQLREEEHATAAAHECGRELLPPLYCSRDAPHLPCAPVLGVMLLPPGAAAGACCCSPLRSAGASRPGGVPG